MVVKIIRTICCCELVVTSDPILSYYHVRDQRIHTFSTE